MKKNITLVGCGNIGSRHLQSLIKFQDKIIINVVEPQIKNQKTAKTLIAKENTKILPTINWFQNILQINQKSDLVIIATNSKGRIDIVSQLLEQGNKRFIIEKIVCQSKSEYIKLLSKMNKFRAKSWVNTPRRYFQSYQKLKMLLDKNNLILHVDAGNLGLGSNAIHILDLFSWFTDTYDITLYGDFLNNKILSNKRGNDFVEFSGTLIGKSKKGLISITFNPNQNIPFTLMFISKNIKIIVDETNSKLILNTGKEKLDFKTDFVSNITNNIVNDILEKDSCLLPTLKNSFIAHTELFRIFNEHLKKTRNHQSKLCPIT